MTGTEPHAPRGTAGRGTNWDRGPCAGHAGAARRCTNLLRSGTVGRGPNRDHRQWTGRGGFASTHAHLGTAGRETTLGIAGRTLAGGAARPGAGNYASSYACLGTAGRETILGIAGRTRAGGAARLGVDLHVYACPPWHRRPRDPQGNRGLWAGRRSCVTRIGDHRSHGLSRDEVTVCLSISCTGGHGNDHVAIIIFYLTTFSEDSQRSSRNSLQALHESRGCIPCTRFNTV